MEEWFFPDISSSNVVKEDGGGEGEEVMMMEETNFEPIDIFGATSHMPDVDAEDMATGRDEDAHEKKYRKVLDLRKMQSSVVDKKVPVSLDPLLFVGDADPPVNPDVFAKHFGTVIAPQLADSLISTELSKRAKNAERGGEWTDKDVRELEEDRYTRKMDDEFLHTPRLWERPCVNYKYCEGFHAYGDILVERPTNAAVKECRTNGKAYKGPRETCVRCKRAVVLKHHMDFLQNCGNMTEVRPQFFSTPDVPGEYDMGQMIVGGGSPGPMHQPLYVTLELSLCYERKVDGDVVWHKQTGFVDPADQDNRPFASGSDGA